MAFTMTQTECESYLAELHVAVIAIQRHARAPLCCPVWYNYTPGGDVRVWTGGDSAKVKLLNRRGRFSLCVQKETPPYKHVVVEGPVISIEPIDFENELRPLAERYLGAENAASFLEDTLGGSEGVVGDVLIRMAPERWTSLDYSKAT